MVGPLTKKLVYILINHDKSSSKHEVQVCVNNNKQPQAIKTYKRIFVGPLTMKLGKLMYFSGERTCQRRQRIWGNKHTLLFIWALCPNACACSKKEKETSQ